MASLGKEAAVTKESKLALIIGFVLVLVVGVLVSDHFSQANKMSHDTISPEEGATRTPIASLGDREAQAINDAFARVQPPNRSAPIESDSTPQDTFEPIAIDNTNPRSILDNAIDYARNTKLPQAASTVEKREERTPEPQRLPDPQYQAYTVQSGDTLIGIARRLLGDGDRYTEIEALNADKLGPDLVITIGMKLRLPSDATIITLGSRETPRSMRSRGERSYTVKPGDTLGEIAFKLLGTSKRMEEIVELNGLDSADTIFVGMTLKIPAK
ncbi:MAG: LysM peptidoglycan-binding domain-containing protein [bacterium]|nr:LysM peptidoglycan-binding domain-containing protein [bacterium]